MRKFEDTNQWSKIEDCIFKITVRSPKGQWFNALIPALVPTSWHVMNCISSNMNLIKWWFYTRVHYIVLWIKIITIYGCFWSPRARSGLQHLHKSKDLPQEDYNNQRNGTCNVSISASFPRRLWRNYIPYTLVSLNTNTYPIPFSKLNVKL